MFSRAQNRVQIAMSLLLSALLCRHPTMMTKFPDDDAVDSNDDDKVPCSPSCASLDSHNLAARSMSPKLKFDGDALHDDRVRVPQGINRPIQLCVTDS